MAGLSVKLVFAGAFLAIMALSVDFWNWADAEPIVAGLPFWVWWDVFLVLCLGAFYILFVRYLWRD